MQNRKMVVFVFLVMAATLSQVESGAACFAACAVACTEVGVVAFAGPLAIAVGYTGCAGVCMVACAVGSFVPPACLASDTVILAQNKFGKAVNKSIKNVKVGDKIATTKDNEVAWTTVVHNVQSDGEFEFYEMEAMPKGEVEMQKSVVKVTDNHGMITVNDMGVLKLRLARDIRVGDSVPGIDTTLIVMKIKKYFAGEKYTLVTANGTFLANGVLVSSLCQEAIDDEEDLSRVLATWKQKHQYSEHF